MAQPTTAVLFSASDPVAPPGLQNTVPQSDGGQPAQLVSQYMPLAIPGDGGAAGTVKPDGTSITQDLDGTIHSVAIAGGGGTGGGVGAAGLVLTPVHPSGARDGSNTQFTLPAPPVSNTFGIAFLNGVQLEPLGASAQYAVQGTQFTMALPPQSTDVLTYYYYQGTPNSESGGGGSVNPVGAPVIRGSAITASASASSLTLAFPAGTQAGDLAILFFCSDFTPGTPSGWTNLYLGTGLTCQAIAASKVLTSGDISTGSATATQTNPPFGPIAADCVLGIVTFVGGGGGVRETEGSQGAGTLVNTTTGAVLSTDVAIYFSGARSASSLPTITPASGSANTLQTSTGPTLDAVMADQAMPGGALAISFFSNIAASAQAIQVIVMAP